MDYVSFISEKSLIIVPVLYIIGMVLKDIKKFPDKFIPLILLIFGCTISILMFGLSISSFIEGVLITGFTVYGNQVFKQLGKKEE